MSAPTPPVSDFQDTAWRTGPYRGLALAALGVGAASGPLAVWQAFSGRDASYVLALAVIAAGLGVVTTQRLSRPDWRQRRGPAYRLGEATLLLLLARVATWGLDVGWPTATQAAGWLRAPFTFVDGPFLLASLALLAAWLVAAGATRDLLDLALQPDEIAAQQPRGFGDSLAQDRAPRPVARADIVGRFAARWIWGGVALVVMAASVRVEVGAAADGALRVVLRDLGLPPVALGGLIAYFLAGLLLVSDARLALLRASWFNQRVTVAAPVVARWRASSLLAVGLAAAAALALPLGPSGWLARAILWVIAGVMQLGMWLYFLLNLLFALLLVPFSRLLDRQGPAPPPEPPPIPAMPSQAEVVSRLPDWLGGAVLWGVVALVAGYLAWSFLQANGLLTGWAGRLARWRRYWRARRPRLTALTTLAGRLARRPARSSRFAPRPSGSSLRWRVLTPRERVRRFYLVALRRAAGRGVERPPHKTPQEFLDDLAAGWPEAERDVRALTEAFAAARYAPQEVTADRERAAGEVWRRVMRALRRPG